MLVGIAVGRGRGRRTVEGIKPSFVQEAREELLEDSVDDVLDLRGHANGLCTDVDGEDFGGPDPDCGSPGGFVEELDCVSRCASREDGDDGEDSAGEDAGEWWRTYGEQEQ